RTEHPQAIIDEILTGMTGAPGTLQGYHVEPDRRKAIARGLAEANPGDVVVVLGKGHETYQEINGERLPFSDELTCRELLGK
ncbi:MAG: UDP-N-acetylmuramoyl-L-alanyl-D-glutamate--2,6-diaminopimelate ligase, partial [Bdellovibrionales bacterium]|nr:UDP-N-acetylmuramoyl-L-alanyl-D-glutamate--2,6-diaminopimelate ligase [Bdellovibrionales bacterium]